MMPAPLHARSRRCTACRGTTRHLERRAGVDASTHRDIRRGGSARRFARGPRGSALALGLVLVASSLLVACGEADPNASLRDEIVDRICSSRARCKCDVALETCRADEDARVRATFDEAAAARLEVDAACVRASLDTLEDDGCRTLESLDRELSADRYDRLLCHTFYGDRSPGEPCMQLELSDGTDCAAGLQCRDGECVPERPWPVAGEGCYLPFVECRDDTTCVTDPATDALTCLATPHEGDPCSGREAACEPGLACDADGLCRVAPGEGDPCAPAGYWENECATGLWCEHGTCVAAGGPGQVCAPPPCAAGLFCAATTKRCEEPWPLACTFTSAP